MKPDGLYQEIFSEHLLTYDQRTEKIERFDSRIEEPASDKEYKKNVHKLTCFIGVKTTTVLAVLMEVSDFKCVATAQYFASSLGLTPGEDSGGDSSGDELNRLGITKDGNRHVRSLLVEAAQSYARDQIGFKSKALKER